MKIFSNMQLDIPSAHQKTFDWTKEIYVCHNNQLKKDVEIKQGIHGYQFILSSKNEQQLNEVFELGWVWKEKNRERRVLSYGR